MKKGFTLIELLAVILILGIIALIAIPTVNNILKEAREGAFKTSSNNIMKAIEEKCQSELIKGNIPVLSYIFQDGKVNHKLEIKGTLPNEGYVILDNSCTIINYYLNNKESIYTDSNDIRGNYMLMAKTESKSIFSTLYQSYYNNIKNINFINNLNYHDGALEIKNVSASGGDEIQSWLVPNGENYDLYIGSLGRIYANYDSSYLFQDSTAEQINFDNFYTNFVTNMGCMFKNSLNLKYTNVSNWDTSNVTNMSSIFNNCNKLISTGSLLNWNTSNVTNMATMFWSCNNILEINVSKWDTSNVTNMADTFSGCNNLTRVDLKNWDTSNVTMMQYLFCNCDSLTELDLSSFDFSNVKSISGFFYDCNNLKKVNLSNFSISNIDNLSYSFHKCMNLANIIINSDSVSINKVIELIPDRINLSVGTIQTSIDKTTINITSAQSKNWNIA